MKQIFLFVLAITLFSYLFADGINTCPPLKGLCCSQLAKADSCKCVDSKVSGCKLYINPCKDATKRLVYVQKANSLETKCIS